MFVKINLQGGRIANPWDQYSENQLNPPVGWYPYSCGGGTRWDLLMTWWWYCTRVAGGEPWDVIMKVLAKYGTDRTLVACRNKVRMRPGSDPPSQQDARAL